MKIKNKEHGIKNKGAKLYILAPFSLVLSTYIIL